MPTVEKMSGGRLIIKPFAGDSIIKNKEVLDGVAGGAFEAGQQSPAYWTGKDAAFVFIRNASAGFDQAWQYNAWLNQGGGMALSREVYAEQGVHLLGLTLRPGRVPALHQDASLARGVPQGGRTQGAHHPGHSVRCVRRHGRLTGSHLRVRGLFGHGQGRHRRG